ncbi:DUF4294 domain-containing protein [Riemerella columbina]|uniref:DUF4294 domain-containing protein n=1 Tax=Riemerella columbina TaxID=103810 RepID=UPI00266FD2EC|nr:DUF4294 domain-containing protein [Riemerella columbina]WKS94537.1 DUF4294 domain-containing protein [Riemerella columbina]
MNFRITTSIISLCFGFLVSAQTKDTLTITSLSQYPKEALQKDESGHYYYYDAKQRAKIYEIDGETVVVLDEVKILYKPKFNNQLDKNYYFFLSKKLNRVYPLFLKALEQYQEVEEEMAKFSDKSEKRRFARQKQEELAQQYEAQLRDLTTSEGRIFAKLMSRATGKTVYEIIKELRGGWSAFWWNVKGNIADVDIKEPYDPHRYRHDEFIESLLQSYWNQGYLEPYEGYTSFTKRK